MGQFGDEMRPTQSYLCHSYHAKWYGTELEVGTTAVSHHTALVVCRSAWPWHGFAAYIFSGRDSLKPRVKPYVQFQQHLCIFLRYCSIFNNRIKSCHACVNV